MKKALFIDRDGTIIAEPADEQIDSLEKLAFVPGAISALKALTGLGFDLVLATNQDGLGTPSFPEDTFWPAHNKMLATLGGEGVAFDDQLIDRTFEAEAAIIIPDANPKNTELTFSEMSFPKNHTIALPRVVARKTTENPKITINVVLILLLRQISRSEQVIYPYFVLLSA